MPIYVYRREDGSEFEVKQRITEDALEVCPTTQQKVTRVISGSGLIFTGSGFYVTDYVHNRENSSSAK
jgi:putative FmdB family regulatory protein